MKPGKIVLIVGAFPKISETFIVNKFIGLLEQGLNVHVICSVFERKNITAYSKLYPYMDRIHTIWPQQKIIGAILFPVLLIISFFRCFNKTLQYFRRGINIASIKRFYQDAPIMFLRPDIIHFEFGALAVGREYLKSLLGCKMVISFRGYDLNFSGIEDPHYYEKTWEHADAIHCLGEDLWRRAQQRGCPKNKAHFLISPAVDTDFFNPKPHSETIGDSSETVRASVLSPALRMLSVGRLEWKKGYEYALQAVKILKDQGLNVHYRIIGSGKYLEAIAFCRHQLGLEDEVKILGSKNPQEIRDEMRRADLFLHPAVSEGFCNAVLEAQSMQLPIVASDAGGLPENVQEGTTGWIVPRRDAKAMADKIQLLAEDPLLRAKMGKAGRERTVSRFQLKAQTKSFQKMYEDLL